MTVEEIRELWESSKQQILDAKSANALDVAIKQTDRIGGLLFWFERHPIYKAVGDVDSEQTAWGAIWRYCEELGWDGLEVTKGFYE